MLRLSAGRLVPFSRGSSLQERRLLGYLARYRRSFLLGFACVVVTNALSLAGPWVLKYAIDDLQSARDARQGPAVRRWRCSRWRSSAASSGS